MFKPVSDRCLTALAGLRTRSRWARLLRRGWDLSAIQELAECGELAALRALAVVLLSGTKREVVAATAAIQTLLAQVAPDDIASLADFVRGGARGERWVELRTPEFAAWTGPALSEVVLCQLASFHSSGYIREAAVQRLRRAPIAASLPYLLLRLDDGVPEVRAAARAAVLDRITPANAGSVAQCVGLIVRLQRAARADLRVVLEPIEKVLTERGARDVMLAALRGPSRLMRRASFRILAAAPPGELPEILAAGLALPDPAIRCAALKVAPTALAPAALRTVLDAHLRDACASVRNAALRAAIAAFPADARANLLVAALDRSAAIRSEARFHLRQHGDLDFAELYREALRTQRGLALAAAMAGLAETGTAADAPTLASHLGHALPCVRKTAVRCVMKLDSETHLESAISCLRDPSAAVAREACQALTPHVGRIDAARLHALFADSADPRRRLIVLPLLAALPGWERLEYLLRAASDGDETVRAVARDHVIRWRANFRGYATVPSAAEIASISAALAVAEPWLPPALARSLRFTVAPSAGA